MKLYTQKIEKTGFIDTYYFYSMPQSYLYTMAKVEKKDRQNSSKTIETLLRTKKRVLQLVNSNFDQYEQRTKFLTITFKHQTQDLRSARSTLSRGIRRLNTYFGRRLRYIIIPERHKSGNIHYHGVFFDMPYIYGISKVVTRVAGIGDIKVERSPRARNVGLYVSKYLTKATAEWAGNTRLIYRSRNLNEPVIHRTNDLEIEKIMMYNNCEISEYNTGIGKITKIIHYKNDSNNTSKNKNNREKGRL